MGESFVDTTKYENKMDNSVASYDRLQVSVSFGKYDNDSLSWEKFSSFSPNKYLEEVEKCATPGSVAEKKAYFEAHYKKIAARKAEQLGQEKHVETKVGDGSCNDSIQNGEEFGSRFDVPSCKGSLKGYPRETDAINDRSSGLHVERPDEDLPINTECKDLSVEEAKEQVDITVGSIAEDWLTVMVNEDEEEKETLIKESQGTEELPHIKNNEMVDILDTKKEKVKLARANDSQKVKLDRPKKQKKATPVCKEGTVVKKKPVSPITNPPRIRTPKMSKPVATNPSMLATGSSTKRTTGASTPKGINPTPGVSTKVVSKSLNMSLGLGPPKSDPAPLFTTRRSFIIEQMGDKDIVKRVFKTFQKNLSPSQSSSEDRSSASKQMSTERKQLKDSAPVTPRKLIGSSMKAVSLDKKNAKAAPGRCGLKYDAGKQEKSTKKLESNSHGRGREHSHPSQNKG